MAASANGHIFVAPDNGVLSLILQTDAAASRNDTFEITNKTLFPGPISRTFHGRDIFAPVAAHLARGTPLESVGPRLVDFVKLSIAVPHVQDGALRGTVLRIDKFGNLITNLRPTDLGQKFSLTVGGLSITKLCGSFSEAKPGELFAIEGSSGRVEVALNQSSAAERLKVGRGAEIKVETGPVNQ
jgi:S-adenosylmethionine hydrolase